MTESHQISVIDSDIKSRDLLYALLDKNGFLVRTYNGARHFLSDFIPKYGCVIASMQMVDMDGLQLLNEMTESKIHLPVILVADHADVKTAVRAIRAGAIDYVEKPFDSADMLGSIEDALLIGQKSHRSLVETELARKALKLLTPRERNVLDHLALGRSNKNIAHELGISARTVEFHRARIMEKLNARHMADVLRLSMTAELAASRTVSRRLGGSEPKGQPEATQLPLWTALAS